MVRELENRNMITLIEGNSLLKTFIPYIITSSLLNNSTRMRSRQGFSVSPCISESYTQVYRKVLSPDRMHANKREVGHASRCTRSIRFFPSFSTRVYVTSVVALPGKIAGHYRGIRWIRIRLARFSVYSIVRKKRIF